MKKLRELKAKVSTLRHRLIVHRKLGQPARKLQKAYNRAKAELATARQQIANSAPRKAVAWAKSQIGVHETGFTNTGKPIDRWEQDFGIRAQPWCGVFVGEALRHAGAVVPNGIVYTPNILNWARAGVYGFRLVHNPMAGDLVLFKFPGVSKDPVDHVGLYIGRGATIEGNTSGSGSQNDGGEVATKFRPKSVVVAYVRPPYPLG